MKTGQVSVHSENLLPIIKKWLYSERDIFVRELAANASDAIQKLQILRAKGEAAEGAEPRIDIRHDTERKALIFSDTGIGLTAEESEKYLTHIAFSGAEEFLKTYQLHDTFIGHFGLGFFSAFIVAERVEVISRSYKENSKAIIWKSDGSSSYTIEEGEREQVGTDVVLFLTKDQEEYLDPIRLKQIAAKFCRFFPYPVFVDGVRVNEHEPLWKKRPTECTESDYISFYRVLYPFEEPPLFWIHLNVDYPFHVQGILYFPKLRNELSVAKDHVQLFCNRVFVSDDCKDVLPEYLRLLKGVLESPDIPLNVSRSYLQVDSTVKQLAGHIAKKVADALSSLRRDDNSRFEKCWSACEPIIKLGMLQDEKFFQRAQEFLVWKTVDGGHATLEEIAPEKKTVIYCELGQESSSLTAAYRAKKVPVIVATTPLDHPLMTRLEREGDYTFKRTDAALDNSLLDPAREKTVLDASGRSEAAKMADFFRSAMSDPLISVEARSLDSNDIPALLTLDEEERRFRDYMHRVSGDAGHVKPKKTFVINTNCPLIQAVCKSQQSAPELSKELAAYVLDLTMLTHRELTHDEVPMFVQRSAKVLTSLAAKLEEKNQ